MPRRIIQRYLPAREMLVRSRSLGWLGHLLEDPNLWHINRRSTAMAVAVGLFCAFVPIPVQMLMAAILAVQLRCNVPVAVALVWISNPLTAVPIFSATCLLGAWLLGQDLQGIATALSSVEALWTQIGAIWWPLWLGSLLTGTVLAVFGYWSTHWFWMLNVRSRWARRTRDRARV